MSKNPLLLDPHDARRFARRLASTMPNHRMKKMEQIEIHLKGRIDRQWSGWFDSLVLTQSDCDETVLTGFVADQAALYGIISHLRDLGLELISVSSIPIETDM